MNVTIKIKIECDHCDNTADFMNSSNDLQTCIKKINEETVKQGWFFQSINNGNIREYVCPECYNHLISLIRNIRSDKRFGEDLFAVLSGEGRSFIFRATGEHPSLFRIAND